MKSIKVDIREDLPAVVMSIAQMEEMKKTAYDKGYQDGLWYGERATQGRLMNSIPWWRPFLQQRVSELTEK